MKRFGLVLCATLLLVAHTWGDGQLYRLVRGSTLTVITTDTNAVLPAPVTTTNTVPMEGTFVLTSVVGPLDWSSYQISDLQLDTPNAQVPGLVISGNGTYRWGGRILPPQQQMTLNAFIPLWGSAVLQADAQPVVRDWPGIDITLEGDVVSNGLTTAARHLELHLIALPELQRWHYRLLEGSTLLDDCPVCDRLSLPQPLRGSFDLVLVNAGPLTTSHHLFNVNCQVGSGANVSYRVSGEGDYSASGEVALMQKLTMNLDITHNGATKTTGFTNVIGPPGRLWPMLAADVDETNGTPAQFYHLQLRAAPLQEVWFTVTTGFNPGAPITTNVVTTGDVLSDMGRVMKSRSDLFSRFVLGTNADANGIDAFDLAPGSSAAFSLIADAISGTLGTLHEGDLLSELGTVVKRNQDLTAKFGLMPMVPDAGLDAVQVLDSGEILFSIRQNQFSESQGVTLGHGDILSDQGVIRRTNASLLAKFSPDQPGHDYGLDAFYVWPSGEVWFSTEEGFNDKVLGPIADGDLLSDQGYIVFCNEELVSRFQPKDLLANHGLRGLFLISDARPLLPAPVLTGRLNDAGLVHLDWTSQARCFRVEYALAVGGPFYFTTPLVTGTNWTGPHVGSGVPIFFRLRQW
jgi:hypothetical protein